MANIYYDVVDSRIVQEISRSGSELIGLGGDLATVGRKMLGGVIIDLDIEGDIKQSEEYREKRKKQYLAEMDDDIDRAVDRLEVRRAKRGAKTEAEPES